MATFTPQPSCADTHDTQSLSVDEAREHIARLVSPLDSWQTIAIRDSLGLTLHHPVTSPMQVPPHNNSAMDGYALRSEDIEATSFRLRQVATAFAGKPYLGAVGRGECIRIMTGAVLPDDCDTVVMQEQVEADGDLIHVHGKHVKGQNVRLAGEDINRGDEVLTAGHKITPADLGLLASLGIAEVSVKRRLRVAFFSTGDELRGIGEDLAPGQIYDSNRYTLFGMLKRLDVEMQDMGVVPDQPQALKQALEQAAKNADVVMTSGGVSVGDADYVKAMLAELGEVDFWKIAMKPGRPLAFGKIANALFFGLPGNPVSVMVTFYQFVQPALKQMMGQSASPPLFISVPLAEKLRKKAGRFEYQRGILFENSEGQLQVRPTGQQGSGILSSMSMANCFILLDENCDGVEPGSLVTVQPFADLV